MKKAIRIRTVSQWYLLKQLNSYLGKKKIPKEVMRKLYYMLCSQKLGKDGFIVLCIGKVDDDCVGMEEIVNMYPYKLSFDEKMDEILIRTGKGTERKWYITYAKISGQHRRIAVVYTPKISS